MPDDPVPPSSPAFTSHAGASRTGAEMLVAALAIHGCDTVTCVPGESYLAVLDALYDTHGVKIVTCRQESGAAFMAEAYGKLTGKPGVCMVTRAPGATNASAGLHVARQDSTPMILFIGQIPRGMRDREAFQEVDYRRMFGEVAKWVGEIDQAARIPEYVAHAYQIATSGRPGPVVLSLPEDVLTEQAVSIDTGAYRPVFGHPGPADVAAVARLLSAAERPLAIVGGAGWDHDAVAGFERFATAWSLPVATAFRRQDRFDNLHPLYAGHVGIGLSPAFRARIEAADLLLVVGARLDEYTTGSYEVIAPPRAAQPLIHVHPGPEEIGKLIQPTLGICASPAAFVEALSRIAPPANTSWSAWAAAANAGYLADSAVIPVPGPVQMGEIVAWLDGFLPADAIWASGAGNYSTWVHRNHRYRGFGTQLSPTSGTMGYGFPAAVAAKLLHPDRAVVCFAGDGCFLMTGQELATAVKHGANVVTIVVNNGMYGTIRMHQEREYPGRVVATDLVNPDFAALARAYGGHGETVERTADFPAAFERAYASGKPALIELRLDPEALTPKQSLSQIRAAGLARR